MATQFWKGTCLAWTLSKSLSFSATISHVKLVINSIWYYYCMWYVCPMMGFYSKPGCTEPWIYLKARKNIQGTCSFLLYWLEGWTAWRLSNCALLVIRDSGWYLAFSLVSSINWWERFVSGGKTCLQLTKWITIVYWSSLRFSCNICKYFSTWKEGRPQIQPSLEFNHLSEHCRK